VNATTGEVTIVSVGTGSVVITATAAAVDGKWAESTADYTLTVGKKTPAPSDLTYSLTSKTYNGTGQPVSVTSSANGIGALSVKYNGSATQPINAGTYSVSVDIAEGTNYSAATLTLGNYTIAPKTITITGATLAAKTYDGTTDATVSTVTFSDTPANYSATAVFADAGAGAAKNVIVTVTLNDSNRTLSQNTYATTSAIAKATTAGVPQTLLVVKNYANDYSFDLTKLLPNLTSPLSLGTPISYTVTNVTDSDSLLATQPTGVITSPSTISAANVSIDATSSITVTVSSANYVDFSAVITVQTTDKYPVAISGVTTANRAYNGLPFAYTGTPILTNTITTEPVTDVSLTATYSSTDDGGYSSINPPKNVGAYKLTLSVPAANSMYTGSEDFPFEITKAGVTVTADNKTIIKGAALPSYTYTQSPARLFGEDEWLTLPTADCPTADANVIDSYPIIVSGGDLGANYNIIYINGTLIVAANNDATLSALSLNAGTLVPAFAANVTVYNVSVANGVSSITITAVSNDALATISGAGTHTLIVGSNIINVVVKAQDGITTKTYKITVTRAPAPTNNNNTGGGGGGGAAIQNPVVIEPPKLPEASPVIITLTIGKMSYKVGEATKTMDVAPFIQDGRTMVPVRFVAESLGAKVSWDEATRTVTILYEGKTLKLVIGTLVSGMDVAPLIKGDRTFIQTRYVMEYFGAKVDWNEASQTVTITKQK